VGELPALPRCADCGCWERDLEEASSSKDATNLTHTDAALEGHADCITLRGVKLLLDKNKPEGSGQNNKRSCKPLLAL